MHSMNGRAARSLLSDRTYCTVIVAVACAAIFMLTAGTAAAAPIKVACLGEHTTHSDSFASNNREAQPPGKQEYPAMLQTLLGATYDVRNFGDCCATVLQGYTPSETHPYVLGSLGGRGPGYNESLAFLPDIVVIGSWGRHDWGRSHGNAVWNLANFQKDYDDLVQRYMKLSSHPKIFVSLPIPILFGQGDVPDNGVTTSSVLPAIKAVAAKYNLPIVDLYSAFLGHMELFKEEGEHVTDDMGLHKIADTVYAALLGNSDAGGSNDAATPSGDAAEDALSTTAVDAAGNGASGDIGGPSTGGGGSSPGAGGSMAGTGGGAGSSDAGGSAASAGADTSGCACSSAGRGRLPFPAALAAAAVVSMLATRRRTRR